MFINTLHHLTNLGKRVAYPFILRRYQVSFINDCLGFRKKATGHFYQWKVDFLTPWTADFLIRPWQWCAGRADPKGFHESFEKFGDVYPAGPDHYGPLQNPSGLHIGTGTRLASSPVPFISSNFLIWKHVSPPWVVSWVYFNHSLRWIYPPFFRFYLM